MLSYNCPSCNTLFHACEDDAGTYLTCFSCGNPIQVPARGGVFTANRTALGQLAGSATYASPGTMVATREIPDLNWVTCPHHGGMVKVPVQYFGRRIRCKHCGGSLRVLKTGVQALPPRNSSRGETKSHGRWGLVLGICGLVGIVMAILVLVPLVFR